MLIRAANKHLTIVAPHVLSPGLLVETSTPANDWHMPVMRKFLGRSIQRPCPSNEIEQLIFQLFNYPQTMSVPSAALAALAEGFPASEGWWLFADPVQLQADMASVYLSEQQHLQLTAEEIRSLHQELNKFLNIDGITLYIGKEHWYLHLADDPQIQTFSLAAIQNQDLQNYLPIGERGQYWRSLLTEMQMLLHTSAVNTARIEQAKPLINSVWLWGEGRLPQAAAYSAWKAIWADHAVTRGLALLAQHPIQSDLPEQANACLAQMNDIGNYLVVLATHPMVMERDEWRVTLQQFEELWIQPLFKALRDKRLASVTFYPGNQFAYQLNHRNVKSWWKRSVK